MANNTEPNEKDQQGTSGSQQHPSGGHSNAGTAAQRSPGKGDSPASDAYKNETGDPGRTPGSAEGVENFEKTGNE